MRILLVSPPCVGDPDLVEQTGADGTAVNAVEALDLAENMVTTRPALLAALS